MSTEKEGKKIQVVEIPKNPRPFCLFHKIDNLNWLKNMAICSAEVTGFKVYGDFTEEGNNTSCLSDMTLEGVSH